MHIRTLLIAAGILAGTTIAASAFEPFYSIGGQHKTIHPSGSNDELLATQEQTDGQLGIIILDGDGPGANIVHASRAEYWYVLEGTYEFTLGDKTFEGGPGTFVATPAKTPHNIHLKSGPGRFLTIFSPGGYEHFFMDWEAKGLSPGPDLGTLENQYGLTPALAASTIGGGANAPPPSPHFTEDRMSFMASLALPVLPGKAERVRKVGKEIAQHQAEWDRLCRENGDFRHYNITLQESPAGDLCIYSMVLQDPSQVRTKFGSGEYDRWWIGFVRDVHGIDLREEASMPPSVFTWHAEDGPPSARLD